MKNKNNLFFDGYISSAPLYFDIFRKLKHTKKIPRDDASKIVLLFACKTCRLSIPLCIEPSLLGTVLDNAINELVYFGHVPYLLYVNCSMKYVNTISYYCDIRCGAFLASAERAVSIMNLPFIKKKNKHEILFGARSVKVYYMYDSIKFAMRGYMNIAFLYNDKGQFGFVCDKQTKKELYHKISLLKIFDEINFIKLDEAFSIIYSSVYDSKMLRNSIRES